MEFEESKIRARATGFVFRLLGRKFVAYRVRVYARGGDGNNGFCGSYRDLRVSTASMKPRKDKPHRSREVSKEGFEKKFNRRSATNRSAKGVAPGLPFLKRILNLSSR